MRKTLGPALAAGVLESVRDVLEGLIDLRVDFTGDDAGVAIPVACGRGGVRGGLLGE